MKRWMWGIATALPMLATTAFVLAFGVDLPQVDEWNMIDGLAEVLAGGVSATQLASMLWFPHNEHTAVFPRALIVLMAWATGWNLRALMILTVLCFGIALLFMRTVLRRIPGSPAWPIAAASCFLFSLHGEDNWLWGLQIHIGLAVLGVIGALCALGRDVLRARWVIAASLCGIVASWSFLNGLVVWPIGLLLILVRHCDRSRDRLVATATWVISGGLAIAMVLANSPARSGISKSVPIGPVVDFAAIYVGAGLLGSTADTDLLRVAGAFGEVALVALSLWILVTRRRESAALAVAAIGAFGLASGYIIALGRMQLANPAGAATSRYTAYSGLCWIAIAVLPAWIASASRPRLRRIAPVFAAVLATVLVLSFGPRIAEGRVDAARRTEAVRAFRTGEGISWPVLEVALGEPIQFLPFLGGRLAAMRSHRLSLFRNANDAELHPSRFSGTLEGSVQPGPVDGDVTAIEARGGVPGNVAFAIVHDEPPPRALGPMHFDVSGIARFVIDRPKLGATPDIQVFTLDRTGSIVQSGRLPIVR